MRAYVGGSVKLAKHIRVGAAVPITGMPGMLEAIKHFGAVLFWLWVIGSALKALGFK